MIAESTGVAQVEDPTTSIGTEDSMVQTSTGDPSVMKFVAAFVAVEATTMTIPEVLAMTSAPQEPAVGLIPAQVELAPVSVDTNRTIIERGSGSASAGLSPATDILSFLGEVPSSLLGCFLRIRSRTSVTLEALSKLERI